MQAAIRVLKKKKNTTIEGGQKYQIKSYPWRLFSYERGVITESMLNMKHSNLHSKAVPEGA